jgi:hypothetical protein
MADMVVGSDERQEVRAYQHRGPSTVRAALARALQQGSTWARFAGIGGLGLAFILVGCATIINGTTQDVGISSMPTGAAVTVDNKPYGITPVIASLSRKDNHIVKIELEGYQPFEAVMTRSASGWVFGNIVFGGVIGVVVDAVSGGLYKLSSEQVTGILAQRNVSSPPRQDGLYVAVVTASDPHWQQIATLTPQEAK